jgi:hypothetical protein
MDDRLFPFPQNLKVQFRHEANIHPEGVILA